MFSICACRQKRPFLKSNFLNMVVIIQGMVVLLLTAMLTPDVVRVVVVISMVFKVNTRVMFLPKTEGRLGDRQGRPQDYKSDLA